jgi:peptide subunit release factor 1 (eRF1)
MVINPDVAIIFEPAKPLKKNDYICDNIFHVDYLLSQFEPELQVGLILITGTHSICYKIIKTGSYFDHQIVKRISVKLQKRQGRGGSSAARIGRIRDEKEEKYVKQVATMIVDSYLIENNTKYICNNIIIAGPGELKHKVMKEPIFCQYFNDRVLSITDSSGEEDIIHKLVSNSRKLIEGLGSTEFKQNVSMVQELIRDASDKLVFGIGNIINKLNACNLEYVFLDNSIISKYDGIIKESNTYGCKVIVGDLILETGIEAVGIKFW